MLHISAKIYTDIQGVYVCVCLTWLSEACEDAEGRKRGETGKKGRCGRRCDEGRHVTKFNEAATHSEFVRPTYWNANMKVEGKERKTDSRLRVVEWKKVKRDHENKPLWLFKSSWKKEKENTFLSDSNTIKCRANWDFFSAISVQ